MGSLICRFFQPNANRKYNICKIQNLCLGGANFSYTERANFSYMWVPQVDCTDFGMGSWNQSPICTEGQLYIHSVILFDLKKGENPVIYAKMKLDISTSIKENTHIVKNHSHKVLEQIVSLIEFYQPFKTEIISILHKLLKKMKHALNHLRLQNYIKILQEKYIL